jgi:hypothetical protein
MREASNAGSAAPRVYRTDAVGAALETSLETGSAGWFMEGGRASRQFDDETQYCIR